jgi:hypothetical protein
MAGGPADRYDNSMPELTLSTSQGSINSATGLGGGGGGAFFVLCFGSGKGDSCHLPWPVASFVSTPAVPLGINNDPFGSGLLEGGG